MPNKEAFLILADGTVFRGRPFGTAADTTGDVVFTTSMGGYQESLTDPGNIGTILCQTFPAAGNYGLNSLDNESPRAWAAGYVTREWCEHPSNFRSEMTLDAFLQDHGIPGLFGIDTRALTRYLRKKGSLRGAIVQQLPRDMDAFLKELALREEAPVSKVSRKELTGYPAEGARKCKVVLYDFGVKEAVVRALCRRGCEVVALPWNHPAKETLALRPQGILLSSGPGDPAKLHGATVNLQTLTKAGLPLFGIGLGHQLLALALGAKTEELPFGHNGANQPVTDLDNGRTYITSQGHSHVVAADSLRTGKISHVNANDGSVEGIAYPALRSFSVQFHPEACAGPEDTLFFFDRFLQLMEKA